MRATSSSPVSLAEPAGTPPIAVVLAIPGSGMLARYFDGPVDGAASLLASRGGAGFHGLGDRPARLRRERRRARRTDRHPRPGRPRAPRARHLRARARHRRRLLRGRPLVRAQARAGDGRRRRSPAAARSRRCRDGAAVRHRYGRHTATRSRRPRSDVGARASLPARDLRVRQPAARAVPAIQASEAAAWPALLRSIASDIRGSAPDHLRRSRTPLADRRRLARRAAAPCSPARPGSRSRSNPVPATTSASATRRPTTTPVRSPSL